jgi:hypothetical protein
VAARLRALGARRAGVDKKPLLFRNELVGVDGLRAVRPADDGEIKRMGDAPTVIELVVGDAVIQVAAHSKDQKLAVGRFHDPDARDAADGGPSAASILVA